MGYTRSYGHKRRAGAINQEEVKDNCEYFDFLLSVDERSQIPRPVFCVGKKTSRGESDGLNVLPWVRSEINHHTMKKLKLRNSDESDLAEALSWYVRRSPDGV